MKRLLFSNSPTPDLTVWAKEGEETSLAKKFGLNLILQGFTNPANNAAEEYAFCRKTPGVTVMPVLANGNLVITRTFKQGINAIVWEFPAGRKPKNATATDQAQAELSEESGLIAGTMISLGRTCVAPRKFDTYEELFVATNCAMGEPKPEPGEILEVYEIDIIEFWHKVFSSEEIVSGFSEMVAARATAMRFIPMISDETLEDYRMHAGNYGYK
ncbi:MAG: NUDIX hydrolase [Parcubacteria group bacterium]|jgi:ADP-ribose pyrophosphatase